MKKANTQIKIGRDVNRAQATNWTAAKLGCDPGYVRGLVNGNFNADGENAQLILRTYREKYQELTKVMAIN